MKDKVGRGWPLSPWPAILEGIYHSAGPYDNSQRGGVGPGHMGQSFVLTHSLHCTTNRLCFFSDIS